MHLAAPDQPAPARHHFNLVLLHQEGNAIGALLDHRIFVLHRTGQLEANVLDHDAKPLGFFHLFEQIGAVEQRFGWDTTDIQTHAAERIDLDNRRLHTELGGADGSDIAARP